MPPPDADLAALPPWRLGAGPRVGVVSLLHITNFPEYRPFRAAEWLAQPAAGRFDLLFLPHSSDPTSDLAWLAETGLLPWLHSQVQAGARLVASGWHGAALPPLTAQLAEGDLDDHRTASLLLGLRLPAPLPSELQLEQLGDWVGEWPGIEDLAARLF